MRTPVGPAAVDRWIAATDLFATSRRAMQVLDVSSSVLFQVLVQ